MTRDNDSSREKLNPTLAKAEKIMCGTYPINESEIDNTIPEMKESAADLLKSGHRYGCLDEMEI